MFRLSLIESDARAFPFAQAGTLSFIISFVAQAALVTAAVVATARHGAEPDGPVKGIIRFLVPPDRIKSREVHQERLDWIAVGRGGYEGTALHDAEKKSEFAEQVAGSGEKPKDNPGDEEKAFVPKIDTPDLSDVMTVLEVDSAVTRDPSSAAPPYPADMLKAHVEGSAAVQFVVDTLGHADTTTFTVLTSTHPSFARSVRETLPHMRFTPAIMQRHKVRQLVQQQFSFKIEDPAPATAPAAAAGSGASTAPRKSRPEA